MLVVILFKQNGNKLLFQRPSIELNIYDIGLNCVCSTLLYIRMQIIDYIFLMSIVAHGLLFIKEANVRLLAFKFVSLSDISKLMIYSLSF